MTVGISVHSPLTWGGPGHCSSPLFFSFSLRAAAVFYVLFSYRYQPGLFCVKRVLPICLQCRNVLFPFSSRLEGRLFPGERHGRPLVGEPVVYRPSQCRVHDGRVAFLSPPRHFPLRGTRAIFGPGAKSVGLWTPFSSPHFFFLFSSWRGLDAVTSLSTGQKSLRHFP